ncbi:hypothetical protein [Acetobacter lovaniensis]|uniref:Uncharacterized protein n=1 Tax=Acetobacter lovaniensis TaxID=104100 RepID=A0A841QFU7_9PROT|nr:hypothetical protein [Acetobacter lovaniensis]MBB6457879.1 hypothetical protein [Acetobacter lovaniensis]NHN82144.1 hypothetical protein [Acetobacter lovaniensis]GBQ66280.1 hypothetical protein AA0474_1075 [Acetobacter lovaniensis NRIC 0474]
MTEKNHEIVLTEDTVLSPGDKVRVGPNVDTPFKSKVGENGECVHSVNSSKGLPVEIQFDDGTIIEGFRDGLILTEFHTGAAPGGAE